MAAAVDNCGSVSVALEEVTSAGACAGDYLFTRTFTATDDCGNASGATRLSLSSTLQHQASSQLITQSVLTNTQWKWLLLLTTVAVVITVEEVTAAGACAGDFVITRTLLLMTVVTQLALLRLSLSSTLQHRSLLSQLITRQSVLTNTQWKKLLLLTTAGEVVITVEEVTTAGSCAGDYVITRTFLLLMTVVTHLALLRHHYHCYVSSLHFCQ